MARQLLLSTTGTLSPVPIADFGDRNFTHPTVDFDLLTEFSEDEVRTSTDLQGALDAGYITLKDELGNNVTSVSQVLDRQMSSENLTYTDTSNKVVGPLMTNPFPADEVNISPIHGIVQEYIRDYTVREVAGGTTPGYYICVGTTSTPPAGGTFISGNNPGTGIDAVLESGDKLRVFYPS